MSKVELGCDIDFETIRQGYRYASIYPDSIALELSLPDSPANKASVFKDGKLVCSGELYEEGSEQAARKFARIIQQIGYPVLQSFCHNI